jgi:4-aminobutyrate aminotransferase
MSNAALVGRQVMDRIRTWPEKHELVGDVRGLGLMIGIEIVTDKRTKARGGPERDRIVRLAFERGVLFLGAGPNTIRFCPPLVVTPQQANLALDTLEECIAVVEHG